MSKSAFIMSTPESCLECGFSGSDGDRYLVLNVLKRLIEIFTDLGGVVMIHVLEVGPH